jgi:hypothetical protein
MKIRLLKTQNGWIVTDQDYLLEKELCGCRVFETMRAATNYLLKLAGETARNKDGRFCKKVETP